MLGTGMVDLGRRRARCKVGDVVSLCASREFPGGLKARPHSSLSCWAIGPGLSVWSDARALFMDSMDSMDGMDLMDERYSRRLSTSSIQSITSDMVRAFSPSALWPRALAR